jgi:hypothetical protein
MEVRHDQEHRSERVKLSDLEGFLPREILYLLDLSKQLKQENRRAWSRHAMDACRQEHRLISTNPHPYTLRIRSGRYDEGAH